MGIFSSTRDAICAVLDTVTDVADTAGKTVGMATTYVDNRAFVFEDEDAAIVATASAKRQAELKRELEADEDATEIYNDLIARMEQRRAERQRPRN
jgi:hypothetical protein